MKVLLVSTSESMGGAAVAARRLTEALRHDGVEATLMVLHRTSDSPHVVSIGRRWQQRMRFLWERLVIAFGNGFHRRNLFAVSIANTGFDITRTRAFREADIIHLHWINQGMLSLRNLQKIFQSGKPVVWTLHDMWPCTAICHHAHACVAYRSECHRCPFLGGNHDHDLAWRTFHRKKALLEGVSLQVVTVSRWLQGLSQSSVLLGSKPTAVIPNTISLTTFHPYDRVACRREFGLPADKAIVIFGAARIDDPIKGFTFLADALKLSMERGFFAADDLHVVLFGTIKEDSAALLATIPVTYTYLGMQTDADRIARLYSAADVVACTSLYETFGQTLIEAMACGCIPVSFGNSGQSDIIDHRTNGYLARYLSADDFAEGLHWALHTADHAAVQREARRKVEEHYAAPIVARQYEQLYKERIKGSKV